VAVWCATRQKARIAFLVGFQRLLAALGLLKGKCALGPFLSILVIECQHKWTYVNLGKVMDKVQIK
jgi:hypothetical protein